MKSRLLICAVGFSVVMAVVSFGVNSLHHNTGERYRITKEVSHVKHLLLACRTWSADHDGEFPPTLRTLYPEYMDVESLLFQVHNQRPYYYFSGLTDTSFSRAIVIYSDMCPTDPPKRAVGFAGGQVVEVTEERFQAAMAIQLSDDFPSARKPQ